MLAKEVGEAYEKEKAEFYQYMLHPRKSWKGEPPQFKATVWRSRLVSQHNAETFFSVIEGADGTMKVSIRRHALS